MKTSRISPISLCLLSVAILGFSPLQAQNYVYFTTFDGVVKKVDIDAGIIAATITVGGNAWGIDKTPDESKIYVANSMSGNVSVIDIASDTVTATITVGTLPVGVGVSADSSKVYIGNALSSSVSVIDTATNMVTATIAVGAGVRGVVVASNGFVYAANGGGSDISVIDSATNIVTATITAGSIAQYLTEANGRIFVTNTLGNNVSVIDTTTNTVVATVAGFSAPFLPTSYASRVYISNNMAARVNIIDANTNTISGTITTGGGQFPGGMAVIPDGTKLAIGPNTSPTNVNVVDTTTNAIIATIPIGANSLGAVALFLVSPPPSPSPSAPALILPPGANANQAAVLNYINSLANIPTYQSIIAQLAALSPSELLAALDAISPARNATETFMTANTIFAANNLILNRLSDQRFMNSLRRSTAPVAALFNHMDGKQLIAATGNKWSAKRRDLSHQTCSLDTNNKDIWIQGFGGYTSQDSTNVNTGFNAPAGGIAIGFDFFNDRGIIGAAAGYANTNLYQHHSAGKANINSFFLSLYGTYDKNDLYLTLSLLGAYNHSDQNRHIVFPGFNQTAKSSVNTYQLLPHLGLGYDFDFCWGTIEPYDSLDWAFSFQGSFDENGASPLNMSQQGKNASMLRNELGLNFYEFWERETSTIVLKETGAYVYKKPFGIGSISAAIVGAPGFFTVESFTEAQNLGLLRLELYYLLVPNNFFWTLSYQGEFGSGYMLNAGQLTVGKYF